MLGRVLLQKAVYDLGAFYLAHANGILSLIHPADIRSDGNAEIANLALKLKLFQGFEEFIFLQVSKLDVVCLVEVYVIGA